MHRDSEYWDAQVNREHWLLNWQRIRISFFVVVVVVAAKPHERFIFNANETDLQFCLYYCHSYALSAPLKFSIHISAITIRTNNIHRHSDSVWIVYLGFSLYKRLNYTEFLFPLFFYSLQFQVFAGLKIVRFHNGRAGFEVCSSGDACIIAIGTLRRTAHTTIAERL